MVGGAHINIYRVKRKVIVKLMIVQGDAVFTKIFAQSTD